MLNRGLFRHCSVTIKPHRVRKVRERTPSCPYQTESVVSAVDITKLRQFDSKQKYQAGQLFGTFCVSNFRIDSKLKGSTEIKPCNKNRSSAAVTACNLRWQAIWNSVLANTHAHITRILLTLTRTPLALPAHTKLSNDSWRNSRYQRDESSAMIMSAGAQKPAAPAAAPESDDVGG